MRYINGSYIATVGSYWVLAAWYGTTEDPAHVHGLVGGYPGYI